MSPIASKSDIPGALCELLDTDNGGFYTALAQNNDVLLSIKGSPEQGIYNLFSLSLNPVVIHAARVKIK